MANDTYSNLTNTVHTYVYTMSLITNTGIATNWRLTNINPAFYEYTNSVQLKFPYRVIGFLGPRLLPPVNIIENEFIFDAQTDLAVLNQWQKSEAAN